MTSRRSFLSSLSALSLAPTVSAGSANASGASAPAATPIAATSAEPARPVSPNDRVQYAAIGLGIMGCINCKSATALPGVELRAACDLYDGRLKHAQEAFGAGLRITRDYREILQDRTIDAVIVSTPDHWHSRIAIEALRAGKAVYLEKPMVHRIDEGISLLQAYKASGKVCQVGSQRVSSKVYKKAQEIYAAGDIGQLVVAEAYWDRQSSLGAWQYSIPRDASPQTIDWERFQGGAPHLPFDPVRFFHWRNYRAYGTGIAGDLFVHLFSGLHVITRSLGPTRIFASGGLRYWKDGRDVPDVLMGIYDYPQTKEHPAFNLQLRVNFIDGGGGSDAIVLVGTEGKLVLNDRGVRVVRHAMGSAPGFGGWDSYGTFDAKNQADFKAWYEQYYQGKTAEPSQSESKFEAEPEYSDHKEHHANFLRAVRGEGPNVEDPTFGLRAAAPALASNMSHFEQRPIQWDPVGLRLKRS
jgi:predicted dehydrogenase